MPQIRQRRPMTKEEALRRQRIREERTRKAAESREWAKGPIDMPFFVMVLLMTAIGLIMLLSASFPSASAAGEAPTFYFTRQLWAAIFGVGFMLLASRMNYHSLRRLGLPALVISAVLLTYLAIVAVTNVSLPLAITRNGATRWIGYGRFQFQPSEVAKIAVVIYFADKVSVSREKMRTFRYGILPYLLILIPLVLVIVLEPHLSGALLVAGAGAAIMLVGGISWIYVGIAGVAGGVGVFLLVFVFGYNRSRFSYWLDPWSDYYNKGYQLAQSLTAIGSGGLTGVGFGKSVQKYLYLPEEHNDFIFAVICEELGLVGASVIILLYMLLILRGYWIALHARDRFGSLLVVGIITLLAAQTFLNIAVVTGAVPTTGISLPFFSYGGTALFTQLVEMGVVLSVSRQMKPTRAG